MKVTEKMLDLAKAGNEGNIMFFLNSSLRRQRKVLKNQFERMLAHNPTFCDITRGAGDRTDIGDSKEDVECSVCRDNEAFDVY